MSSTLKWTSADLEAMPDDGKRREIIDGELYVSKQPHWYHQFVCNRLGGRLDAWSFKTDAGEANGAPGLIFSDEDDVAPDLVWVSRDRLATALGDDGRLYAAPELVIEVLSPGSRNQRRDREIKLKLYSRRGVDQYWIVDWRARKIEVYSREDQALALIATFYESDTLQSSLLPGFSCPVAELFPQARAES